MANVYNLAKWDKIVAEMSDSEEDSRPWKKDLSGGRSFTHQVRRQLLLNKDSNKTETKAVQMKVDGVQEKKLDQMKVKSGQETKSLQAKAKGVTNSDKLTDSKEKNDSNICREFPECSRQKLAVQLVKKKVGVVRKALC